MPSLKTQLWMLTALTLVAFFNGIACLSVSSQRMGATVVMLSLFLWFTVFYVTKTLPRKD